jgi:hypothetical protein
MTCHSATANRGLTSWMILPNACRRLCTTALLLLACTHTDSYPTPPLSTVPPFSTGPDVQLTFNVDQNYWPTWTQDGRGILYSFVNLENTAHRCLGLLPASGGTRIWELCDNRAVRNDTVSSYSAYALDSAGRLLLVEALSSTGFSSSFPFHIRLQLTDTAAPYMRTTLLSLPITVGGTPVTWLSEITWTGTNTFLALGQEFEYSPHCSACGCLPCPNDSIFGADGGIVLTGTLTAGHVALQMLAGTDSATGYSLAENGASIVYTRRHDLRLFKVPISGGIPVPTPIVRTGADTASLITGELAGVSCKGSTCLVALDRIFVAGAYFASCGGSEPCSLLGGFLGQQPTGELHRLSLASGADETVQSNSVLVIATPQISPVSGDVVLQLGGVWGHLQTHSTGGRGNGELHLLKGLVP